MSFSKWRRSALPLATNGTQELEEGIIKEEILPALGNDIAPRLEPIKRDLVLVVEYHPGEPISVALSRKTKISEIMGAKTLTVDAFPKKVDFFPVLNLELPKLFCNFG